MLQFRGCTWNDSGLVAVSWLDCIPAGATENVFNRDRQESGCRKFLLKAALSARGSRGESDRHRDGALCSIAVMSSFTLGGSFVIKTYRWLEPPL